MWSGKAGEKEKVREVKGVVGRVMVVKRVIDGDSGQEVGGEVSKFSKYSSHAEPSGKRQPPFNWAGARHAAETCHALAWVARCSENISPPEISHRQKSPKIWQRQKDPHNNWSGQRWKYFLVFITFS